MYFVQQDDAAVMRANSCHHVVDKGMAVGSQNAAGDGFAGIYRATLVESPVAGVDVPADDPVATPAQQGVGVAGGVAIGIAEQLRRLLAFQQNLRFEHLQRLLTDTNVVEVGVVPRMIANGFMPIRADLRYQFRVLLGLAPNQEKGGLDVVLFEGCQNEFGVAGLRSVVEGQDDLLGRWRHGQLRHVAAVFVQDLGIGIEDGVEPLQMVLANFLGFVFLAVRGGGRHGRRDGSIRCRGGLGSKDEPEAR